MISRELQVGGFDYSQLPSDLAQEARTVAARVRSRHQGQIAAMIETGRDLARIKVQLEHGQFGVWIDAEFGMTIRSAQRYMVAAANLADKSDTVSYLPASAVHTLAAAPMPVREGFLSRAEAGERLDPIEINETVKEAKQAERSSAKLARMKPQQKKSMKRREAAIAREDKEIDDRQRREKETAREAIAFLRQRLSGDEFVEFVRLMGETTAFRFLEAIRET